MADRTKIEWTDATWNPFRGCSRVSEGCRNCYAERMAGRFAGEGQPFHGFVKRMGKEFRWTGRVASMPDREQPFRWRKPRRIFVNSMSDTFHEAATADSIAYIFATMTAAHYLRGHVFQVLTKRADRMATLLHMPDFWTLVNRYVETSIRDFDDFGPHNPPDGIWLGVSIEDQTAANQRINALLATPAKLRFLSCEPLLGPITLHPDQMAGIDWVIVGGESGPSARPMHPDWARHIRDHCAAADVPFFFKQWGEWAPAKSGDRCIDLTGRNMPNLEPHGANGDGTTRIQKLGKRRAGRLLDGLTHDAFPDSQPGQQEAVDDKRHPAF